MLGDKTREDTGCAVNYIAVTGVASFARGRAFLPTVKMSAAIAGVVQAEHVTEIFSNKHAVVGSCTAYPV